jgi:hypothetical protein
MKICFSEGLNDQGLDDDLANESRRSADNEADMTSDARGPRLSLKERRSFPADMCVRSFTVSPGRVHSTLTRSSLAGMS